MFVSVIVCTCRDESFTDFQDAVASLLSQTYPQIEIIIVVDGCPELYQKVEKSYAGQTNIQITGLEESQGVSGARDFGIQKARGDIIAFLDDDAVADKDWVDGLVDTYSNSDAIATAGRVLPLWLGKKPDYLPEELYWLLGLTYKGFAEEGLTEVRNALGSNMSFRREVFEQVGTFSQNFGFAEKGASNIQAEEPELALRIKNRLGRGVLYNPALVVRHRVPEYKTKVRVLLKRAFYQGYSKALLKRLSPCPNSLDTEGAYLKDLLFRCVLRKLKALFSVTGSVPAGKQLLVLVAITLAVAMGFVYGLIKRIPEPVYASSAK